MTFRPLASMLAQEIGKLRPFNSLYCLQLTFCDVCSMMMLVKEFQYKRNQSKVLSYTSRA